MAGSRCPPEEPSSALDAPSLTLHYSDDERSVAADSWSVKSEYGSTLDGDDQRNADVVDALNASSFRPSDYISDKEEQDAEVEPSVLGLQSHWDSTYADELVNFHEQGDNGEIWFGEEVMDTMAAWTARVCIAVAAGIPCDNMDGFSMGTRGLVDVSAGGSMALELANWSVLDLGTGNGLLLHALAKQGFTNLTGTDYSEAGVELARAISVRSNVDNITFLVDDVLDTKINQQFRLVTDKGTLDAIGLHPDGPARRIQYWKSVCKLLAPGGILAITSCNSTRDELVAEVNRFTRFQKSNGCNGKDDKEANGPYLGSTEPTLEYIDHIRTYPTFRMIGSLYEDVYLSYADLVMSRSPASLPKLFRRDRPCLDFAVHVYISGGDSHYVMKDHLKWNMVTEANTVKTTRTEWEEVNWLVAQFFRSDALKEAASFSTKWTPHGLSSSRFSVRDEEFFCGNQWALYWNN